MSHDIRLFRITQYFLPNDANLHFFYSLFDLNNVNLVFEVTVFIKK